MLPPKDYTSSRVKTGLMLAGSLIFVAAALFLPRDPGRSQAALTAAGVFFGLGALVAAVLLVRPQRLRLDGEGFIVSGGFVRTPHKVPWRDIDPMFVYRLPRGGKMIGYNFVPGARERNRLAIINRRWAGAEAALPKLWSESPEQMVEEINAYRAKALGEPGRSFPSTVQLDGGKAAPDPVARSRGNPLK